MATLNFNSVSIRFKTETNVADSRFVAIIKNVSSEEEAKEFLTALKKENRDAIHICYAYILYNEKTRREKVKFSDNGEPDGSAGAPIFGAMRNAQLGNAVVAVVRYNNGGLLGQGLLTRSYAAAAEKVIKNAPIVKVSYMGLYEYVASYAEVKKIEALADEGKLFRILEKEYEADVVLSFAIRDEDYKKAVESLNKVLGKKIVLKFVESRFV